LEFYALGKLLGRGAFGKVNVGVHKLTEELTAVKMCERKRIAEAQGRKCLMQEVAILTRLNGHPNIIQLFEVIETASHVVLVLEFASGGDLLRYVRQRRRLDEVCARDFFKQLLDGISHIHGMGIVHRDIKLENLLLDSFGCLKIADLGVAVVLNPQGRRLTEHCGTPSYIAPEILLEAGYDGQPVDLWSAGVVLYAMLCGRVPFKGESPGELKRCILKGKFHLPSHLSERAMLLLRQLLVVDPGRRATLREALAHNWCDGACNRAQAIFAGSAALAVATAVFALRNSGQEPHETASLPFLPEDPAVQKLLHRVAEFGFPQSHVEESLREGLLNHATAAFHLLAHQAVRRKAGASITAPTRAMFPVPPMPAPEEPDTPIDSRTN